MHHSVTWHQRTTSSSWSALEFNIATKESMMQDQPLTKHIAGGMTATPLQNKMFSCLSAFSSPASSQNSTTFSGVSSMQNSVLIAT